MAASGINIFALILVVTGGLAAFALLRFLHKKLHVFTRGTVSFMVLALVGFTIISVLTMLHDVKLDEERARGFARRRAVHGALLGWLGDEEGAASREFRANFSEDIEDIEKQISRDVKSVVKKSCCPEFDDLHLVALDVDWRPTTAYVNSAINWQRRHCWDYEAVFHDEDSGDLHRIRGKVITTDPKNDGFVITGVQGKLAKPDRNHFRRCLRLIDGARVFREASYNSSGLEAKVSRELRSKRGFRSYSSR